MKNITRIDVHVNGLTNPIAYFTTDIKSPFKFDTNEFYRFSAEVPPSGYLTFLTDNFINIPIFIIDDKYFNN